MRKYILIAAAILVFSPLTGASADGGQVLEFPITELGDIITRSGVEIDAGNGNALLIDTKERIKVELFDIRGQDFNNTRLVYNANIRSDGLTASGGSKGIAYLEMTVVFPGGEELVARGPRIPVSGTMDWRAADTVLYVDKGVNPESVKLDIVVDAKGKVWIEDVRLSSRPLRINYLLWGHIVVWLVLIIYIYHLLRKQGRLSREIESLSG